MSDATDTGPIQSLFWKWHKNSKIPFNFVDKIIYFFGFLTAFDDVMDRVLKLLSFSDVSDVMSEDWLYDPIFLFNSVMLPSFCIGKILAKKCPQQPDFTDPKTGKTFTKKEDSYFHGQKEEIQRVGFAFCDRNGC